MPVYVQPSDAGELGEPACEGAELPISDEELAELALAADPDEVVPHDAVPLPIYLGSLPLMLPQWYMPPAIASVTAVSTAARRWRTALVIALVVAFVMIDAWGLCSTYGSLTLA